MNLFAYGTLLIPEIWQMVVGQSFLTSNGALRGYEIRRVEGATFPAIFESDDETASVPGQVFHDLTPEAIARLDAYEDVFYLRREVEIDRSADELPSILAQTYVVATDAPANVLSDDEWTLDWFIENDLEAYLSRMRGRIE